LSVFEEIITSYDDELLNDNSNGFSNYAAPGADRLRITVTLSKVPIGNPDQKNFIELMEIINGVQTAVRSKLQNIALLQKNLQIELMMSLEIIM
jgi:hypothetical protein